jgi:hypothetical protein
MKFACLVLITAAVTYAQASRSGQPKSDAREDRIRDAGGSLRVVLSDPDPRMG